MLLTIIILLFIGSAAISLKEIFLVISISNKPKPSTAKECYFCKVEVHEETGTAKNIYCTHPYGKVLSDMESPLQCADKCPYGFLRDDKVSYEKAINISSIKHTLAVESFRFLASLVPSVFAVIKLLGK